MELIIFKNLSVNQIINFCGIRLEKKDYLEDFIESWERVYARFCKE